MTGSLWVIHQPRPAIVEQDDWTAGSYHGLRVIEPYDAGSAGGDMIHAGEFDAVSPNDNRQEALNIALYLGLLVPPT